MRGKRRRPAGASAKSSSARQQSWAAEIGVFVVVIMIAWYFVYLRYLFNAEFPLATLSPSSHALADGTAYIPFQFRALVPWIAGTLASMGVGDLPGIYKWLDVLSVIGIFYAFRLMLKGHFDAKALLVLPFAIFYLLPWNYLVPRGIPILLPYDLPAVMFLSLGLALLRRRLWRWYYPVLVIGCLNRETMVLLAIVLFAVEFRRLAHQSLVVHLLSHIIIWLGVRFLMLGLYGGNPGSSFELYHVDSDVLHLKTNLDILLTPAHLIMVLSSFGFAWILLITHWKKIGDRFSRRALWLIPPYLLLTFVAGNINEIRVFGELTPLVAVPALMILSKTWRDHSPAREP